MLPLQKRIPRYWSKINQNDVDVRTCLKKRNPYKKKLMLCCIEYKAIDSDERPERERDRSSEWGNKEMWLREKEFGREWDREGENGSERDK